MSYFRHFGRRALGAVLALGLGCGGCSDSPEPLGPLSAVPPASLPGEVPAVTVDHGPQPGQAAVSWRILPWSTHPIKEYQVAVATEGPITAASWERARILGHHPWAPGRGEYREIYAAAAGLVPGQEYWFAVRACDEAGTLSLLSHSPRLRLSTAWWIEGRVGDFAGRSIGPMRVTCTWNGLTTLTDAAGHFRIGPFRHFDQIVLEAGEIAPGEPVGGWYGFTRAPLRRAPGADVYSGLDFFLIPRYRQDPRCAIEDNTFLTYLRMMTYTLPREDDPGPYPLYRWEHYPLSVFIPEVVNAAGIPMHEGARNALELWNLAMGETYFHLTEDSQAAEVTFVFEDRDYFYGLVYLLEPDLPGVELGEVIPTKVGVFIDTELSTLPYVTEVTLHELGHVLGLVNHSNCPQAGYLMEPAGGFGALGRLEPVHLDERRAVECIRYLPQGQDMGRYH